jgi:hypothetical protein
VAATSASDAWAVGSSYSDHTVEWQRIARALTYHWTGAAWHLVPNPSAGSNSALSGVAASSARDVWAVGGTAPVDGVGGGPLILHWTGTAWRTVPCPDPKGGLSGVAVRSADDAWAVGETDGPTWQGPSTMFILHWNGRSWRPVAAPAVSDDAWLSAVAVSSAQNAWAVGGTLSGKPVAVHWNGRAWRIVPGMPANAKSLDGVAIVAPNDVWAVGSTQRGATFIERWNGRAWQLLPSPSPGGGSAALNGVAATSASNAWAVGGSSPAGPPALAHILHWNGTSWQVSPAGPGSSGPAG